MITKNLLEIIMFIKLHKNGYTKWEGKWFSSSKCHEILRNKLQNLFLQILQRTENHEIMKIISKKPQKTMEEENVLRWWDESFSYPKWSKNTEIPQKYLFKLHTVPVTKQTILLWNFLELSRQNNLYETN